MRMPKWIGAMVEDDVYVVADILGWVLRKRLRLKNELMMKSEGFFYHFIVKSYRSCT